MTDACGVGESAATDGGDTAEPKARVSVKTLAEFVHRRGDIHYRYQSATLAREGIVRQRAWQRGRGESYRREVRVAADFGGLRVSGRVDGWDEGARLVEEVKTTRAAPAALHAQAGHAHLAQVRLYAAMLALQNAGLEELRLRLVYLHPERPDETAFDEQWPRPDLIAFFEATCGIYAAWLAGVRRRLTARDDAMRRLRFPYAAFRAEQRRVATRLYRAFRDGVDWLVEAPTGAGKTMASVFPAVKAIGEGALDRLIYLTARNTGQRAVEDALARAAGAAPALAAVTVTAKERICFNPGTPCDPARCEFARGYYQRLPAARRALLAVGLAGQREVEHIARAHLVCPFELSLDTAAWADVVVCDYNYVFDPVVRLKRLDNDVFGRVGLVVDEAHQLGDRVREMLSATIARRDIKAALRDALPAALARRFRSVDRALAALGRDVGRLESGEERAITRPDALDRAIRRLTSEVAIEPDTDLEALPAAADAYWQLLRFERALDWAGEAGEAGEDGAAGEDSADGQAFHYLASGSGRDLRVELACAAPGGHIRATMAAFQGTVRQSGTLASPRLVQRTHGFPACAQAFRAGGAGEAARLGTFVVPDVSTYYRDRARTLPSLTTLIAGVAAATPGNCLVAFPSFEYLAMAATDVDPAIRCQTPNMTPAEREDFIGWLGGDGRGRVGFAVMGGVFTESVDFDSRALRAVVVVGPGLPPRSVKRDLIAAAHAAGDAGEGGEAGGFDIAYRQPAMTRVVQTVGRIARRPETPGVAVLVDARFAHPAYRALLPAGWRLAYTPRRHVATAIGAFWAAR